MNQRLAQLLDFLKDEPNDPFLLYAIATEYKNGNDIAETISYFNRLLQEHPNYLATYYHAAHFFTDLEEFERAKMIYEKGIELAKEQQEKTALRELQNAYNMLLFELEDD